MFHWCAVTYCSGVTPSWHCVTVTCCKTLKKKSLLLMSLTDCQQASLASITLTCVDASVGRLCRQWRWPQGKEHPTDRDPGGPERKHSTGRTALPVCGPKEPQTGMWKSLTVVELLSLSPSPPPLCFTLSPSLSLPASLSIFSLSPMSLSLSHSLSPVQALFLPFLSC